MHKKSLSPRPFTRNKSFWLLLITIATVGLLGHLGWEIYHLDPYFSKTKISSPYITTLTESNEIKLDRSYDPELKDNIYTRSYGMLRSGLRIALYSTVTKEDPLPGNEQQIIDQIHRLRFNPDKPYVITGSHYSDLYIRNAGTFFNALIDPRLPTTQEDWQNRQKIALKTTAYDLDFLEDAGAAVTTIVPLSDGRYTGVNIYTPPSDALFSVVYTLKALSDPNFVMSRFPLSTKTTYFPLQTISATNQLLAQKKAALTTSINQYLSSGLDPETHLVRTDIYLSSARDGVKRESSFYDNVIMWATVQLADELGIPHLPTIDRESWKQKIISAFWDEEVGIFKDDLSPLRSVIPGPTFSADSLIVVSTGFLDLKKPEDHQKLISILDYIQTNKLDQPFPLRYSSNNQNTKMHWAVKTFAASYMGEGIWSHWGMEYIKALVITSPDRPEWAELADKHLMSYKANIEKYGGYPELYNTDGTIFNTRFVDSVLHTGWVVNYEQAKVMANFE